MRKKKTKKKLNLKLLYEIQQIRSTFQATKSKLLSRYIRKLNSEINKRRNEWNM